LGPPFPLQRTDYLVVCFCRFVILFFFLFRHHFCEANIVLLVSSCCAWKKYHTLQFVATSYNRIGIATDDWD
jgi:hypothetical protein